MAIRNETLRKKLDSKKEFLLAKIAPLHEELEMVNGMILQMDTYEDKSTQTAEEKLGICDGYSDGATIKMSTNDAKGAQAIVPLTSGTHFKKGDE